MKICFITSDVNPHAGLGRVVNSLASEFSLRGYEVGIVSPVGSNDFDSCSIPLRLNYRHPLLFFMDLLKMRGFLKRYDILVAFDPKPVGVLTYIANVGLNKKIILQTLGTYALFEHNKIIKNFFIELVYKKVFKVFVINSFVKKCIEESKKGFAFGDNLSFVPVGVDTKLFYINTSPSYTYAAKYIISVGGIKLRKGQFKSVQAFIKISDEFPDLHYVLVGDVYEDVEYIGQIRSVISKANLDHRIHFLQKISDEELIDLYSGSQFFVLTPTTTKEFIEGFGMVYLEAALCGATSLGTKNTGAEAAIEHKKSGLLVSEEVDDIAQGMKDLLCNPLEREVYKKYARERALLYDWTKIVDLYEKEIA